MKTLIKNANIFNSKSCKFNSGSLTITDDKISQISYGSQDYSGDFDNVIDANNMLLVPGFYDMHTHGREGFDFAVARAVAPLPVLLEYCLPFIKKGGSFFAYKGPEGLQEARASLNALQILGGEIANTYEETLPQEKGKRCLLTIKKTGKTPEKFPRRSGMPEKKPL